jgi:hypothetical protein
MILLGTGSSADIVLIVFVLFLLLTVIINKQLFFKVLAKVNKLIIPTMMQKDFSNLKTTDKLIIAYRYWVTKNSL